MENNGNASYPQVLFFPLEPAERNELSEIFSRSVPKYFSTRLESLGRFRILNVYFLMRETGHDQKVFTPDSPGNHKFVEEYIQKSNIPADYAVFGTMRASGGSFSFDLSVYDVKSGTSMSAGNFSSGETGLMAALASASAAIAEKLGPSGGQLEPTEKEALAKVETGSYAAFYNYLACVDMLAQRNPYQPLGRSVEETAFASLSHDPSFSQMIDIVSFICDDHLRFSMPDAAVAACEKGLKITHSFKLYLTLGKIHLQTGNMNEAFKSLRECIELNPSLGDVAHNFGQMAMDMGRYDDARFAFNAMINGGYKLGHAYDSLGVISANTGDVEEAMNCWHSAIEFDPSKVSAYANLGRAHMESGNYERAKHYLDRAASINPSYFMTYLNYSALFRKLGDMAKSNEYMNKAIFYNPDLALTDDIRQKLKSANDLIDSDREEEALPAYDEILLAHSRCWQAFFFKGIALRKMKRNDAAEEMFQKACEINQKFPDSRNELGLLYLMKGNFTDAMLLFTSALELSPNNAGFICNMGLCHLEMGNMQEAANAFSRAKFISPKDPKIDECMEYMKKKNAALQKEQSGADGQGGKKGIIDKFFDIFKK